MKASDNAFPGIIIRESADDGSDFSNPSADYRRLFLGEDGQLHVKDSAGAVTDIGGGDISAHTGDTTDAHDASAISFDPTGLTNTDATDVQEAIADHDAAIASGGFVNVSARAKRTSGNLVLNSGSFADVDNGLDLTVAAVAGDVLLVAVSALIGAETQFLFLDAASIVSGSPVNYVSGGHTQGVAGWMGVTTQLSIVGAAIQYVVVSGDISGGNVVLRLRYKAGGNKTLYASTTDGALQWSVVNLGQ